MGARRHPKARPGLTLDAGALIGFDRGDQRATALLLEARRLRRPVRVPSGVVGQAWRNGQRQARLARLLAARQVEIVPLDDRLARAAGELCGRTGTSDVIDASVVLTARLGRDTILTSDPEDLRKLDATAKIERV